MAVIHYIRAGWLIDGSGSPVQRDVVLTVVDGLITAIDTFRERFTAGECQYTDLSFGVIMPPFIDSHVHLAMSGVMDERIREQQLTAGCEELEPYIIKHLKQLLSHGVLTVRDGGDRDNCVLNFMKSGRLGGLPVSVESPGRAWHKRGRYGSLIGRSPNNGERLAEAYRKSNHSGKYLKLVNSGLNSLKNFGKETEPQFFADEIGELVQQVEKDGGKVMVHANGQWPVREALLAGCHSIEHGFFMGRDNLELMAEKGCVWVPTTCTMKAYAEILEYRGSYKDSGVAAKNLDHQLDQLRMAREVGVKVALGTDSGSPGVLHGEAVFEEMKLMARAGYSLAEIVASATSIGAELLSIKGRGVLQAGSVADFLVTRGTPAQLPRKFSYLENIYLGGSPWEGYRKNPLKHVHCNV